MLAAQPNLTTFQSASLYVGDLQPEVTESTLFELFNRVGPVASIRVCRDSVTRKSLGYAYVNFQQVQDAERALDTMNFAEINGRPCRIMWSQRDPSLRKTGLGNVFVRNLAPSVDNKGLYDTFSVFGNILSCKVATDENGRSKGYGYVHFETAEAAQDAIQKFNGMLIEEVEVHVGHFVRRDLRSGQNEWTNLYIKQFPLSWDEAQLRALFEPFGTIVSLVIMQGEGKSKGFGFVNYDGHDAAMKAVDELNNKVVEDSTGTFNLYVGRAQKKVERSKELKARQEMERVTKFQGMNLYVKNISDVVTDEMFREAFTPFGNITSARIMRESNDTKTSKGFGFVCYSSIEDANKAVAEMNGKNFQGKPLYVTHYQRKDQRRAQLAAAYAPQNMRFPQNMNGGMPMPYMNMYMAPGQGGFPGQAPRGNVPFGYNAQGGAPRGAANAMGPRGAVPPYQQRAGYYPPYMQQNGPAGPGGNNAQQMQGGFKNGAPRPAGAGNFQMQPGSVPAQNMNAQRRPQMGGNVPMAGAFPANGMQGRPMQMAPQVRPYGQQMPFPGQQNVRGVPANPAAAGGIKFNSQARNQNGQMQNMMPAQPIMSGQPSTAGLQGQSFSEALLSTPDPSVQKNMIGEKLFPLIFNRQPELAGKITGMLLEMDNGELLNLIESPEALDSKIQEALLVLRNHGAAGPQM